MRKIVQSAQWFEFAKTAPWVTKGFGHVRRVVCFRCKARSKTLEQSELNREIGSESTELFNEPGKNAYSARKIVLLSGKISREILFIVYFEALLPIVGVFLGR